MTDEEHATLRQAFDAGATAGAKQICDQVNQPGFSKKGVYILFCILHRDLEHAFEKLLETLK